MVFDIGMRNIAVNLLDGAFEIVRHKKADEINLSQVDLKRTAQGSKPSQFYDCRPYFEAF